MSYHLPSQSRLGIVIACCSLVACQTTPAEPASLNPYALPNATTRSTSPRDARINGGIAIVAVPDGVNASQLRFQGHPVWIGTLPGLAGRQAVLGLDLGLGGTTAALQANAGEQPPSPPVVSSVTVAAQTYPEQHLTLTQTQYVNPDPEQLARFEREAAEQKQAYRQFTPPRGGEARWPTFRWPLTGHLSSPFGLRRFFNEEPRAPHLGVDIAGSAGMIAVAPADGVVALTGDYFFNGRTVIIDHGQGLYSMLCHFQKVLVMPGQVLKAGDAVGEVGSTGRATAPHLHWTVSLNDARIDPRWLFPADSASATP